MLKIAVVQETPVVLDRAATCQSRDIGRPGRS